MATLLGPDGRPIRLRDRDLTEEIAAPSLASIRNHWSSYPSRNLAPGRLTGLLAMADEGDADAYLELAEEMEEKDAHYAAVIATRKRAVAQLPVHVEPASDDNRDREIAEAVEREIFGRDEFQDELIDLLDAIAKGFAVAEIVWRREPNLWTPGRIVYRNPRWFAWDHETQSRLQLRTEEGLADLAPARFIVHVAKAKSGIAIRGGLARPAAWLYLFRNYAVKDWVVFLERFATPMRLGKYGAGASEDDKQILLRALSNLGHDAAAAIPENMLVEFVEAKISGSVDAYERFLRWAEAQISKLVLGQTETTDATRGGYATAAVHERVKEDICASDARQLSATLTRDLIRPFVDFNFGQPAKGYPRAWLALPPAGDVATLANALTTLVPLGLSVPQTHVRKELSIPEPDEGEELLAAPTPAAPPPAIAAPASRPPATPDEIAIPHMAPADDDDAVDALIREQLEDWAPLMEPLVEPITDLVAEIDASDGDDAAKLRRLQNALAERLAAMDASAFESLLERSMFNARLAGETGADLRDDD